LLNIYFPELKLNGIGKYLQNEKTDKLIKEYLLFTKQISFVHPLEKLLTTIIQETYGYIAMGGGSPHIPPDINKNVTMGGTSPISPPGINKNVTNSETQTEITSDLFSQLKNFSSNQSETSYELSEVSEKSN